MKEIYIRAHTYISRYDSFEQQLRSTIEIQEPLTAKRGDSMSMIIIEASKMVNYIESRMDVKGGGSDDRSSGRR